MGGAVRIEGICDERFARVRDRFAAGFESGEEIGAAVCVTLGGETVVDLWGGSTDAARTQAWRRETLVNVYSTTKGLAAICALRLVDEGELDLEAPAARYWPEFGAAGKAELPVRYLLTHQAGLPAVRRPLPAEALYDWEAMTGALAEQEPWWEPGAAHGYHALTYGWLVGELIRRVSGRTPGRYLREEVARPLGIADDLWIGLPEALDERVSNLVPGPVHEGNGPNLLDVILNDPESLAARAFVNPPLDLEAVNTRPWRAAEIPAANGHATAAALARVYAALAAGGEITGFRLLSEETIDRARTPACEGEDPVLLGLFSRMGLGFMLPTPEEPWSPNPRAFGHAGMGGSFAMADPERRLSFAYTMNHMHFGRWLVDPRPTRLLAEVYAAL